MTQNEFVENSRPAYERAGNGGTIEPVLKSGEIWDRAPIFLLAGPATGTDGAES
jgi:hypothetical protein